MRTLVVGISIASVALVGCARNEAMGLAGAPSQATSTKAQAVHSACPHGATTLGIDVSEWQGGIDWNAVKGAGVQFAFIRVADGTYHDQTYHQNWDGARAAGVLRGTYQFFRSNEDPIVQADVLINEMGALQPGDLPPVADVETTDGVDSGTRAARLHQWLDHVQQATGRTPIIYVGGYFWEGNVGQDFSGYPLWHAGYTGGSCPSTVADQWSTWTFWQYTDAGSFPGIGGNVDTDEFNGSLADLQSFAQSNAPPIGYLDVADCDAGFGGWAQDPDAPDAAIFVDLYIDGPPGSGAAGFRTTANIHRDDLCAAIGSCEHGFDLAIPFAYRDGAAHTVFAYGIDTAGGNNPELSDDQLSFTCGPPALPLDAKAGVLRWVTSPDAMTAWNFGFPNVAVYSDGALAAYAHAADWPSDAPALVQASGEVQVYVVENNTRRYVTSPDAMAAWGFDFADVQVQDPAIVHAIPEGPALPDAPFLLRGSGSPVYVLDNAPPPPPPPPPPAPSGEGEGAAGEGEGSIAGEGEGDVAGEGEGDGSTQAAPRTKPTVKAGGCASTSTSTVALVALAAITVRRRKR